MRRTDWVGIGLIAVGAAMVGVNAVGQSIPVATIAVESVPTPLPALPPLQIPHVRFQPEANDSSAASDSVVVNDEAKESIASAISVVGTVVYRNNARQSWATVVDAGGFRTVYVGSALGGSRVAEIDDGAVRLLNGTRLSVAAPSYSVPGISSAFANQTVPVNVAKPSNASPAETGAASAPTSASQASTPAPSSSFSQHAPQMLDPMALPTPSFVTPQSLSTPDVLTPESAPTPTQLLPTGDLNGNGP